MTVSAWCKVNDICEQTYYRNLKVLREELCNNLPVPLPNSEKPTVFKKMAVTSPIPDTDGRNDPEELDDLIPWSEAVREQCGNQKLQGRYYIPASSIFKGTLLLSAYERKLSYYMLAFFISQYFSSSCQLCPFFCKDFLDTIKVRACSIERAFQFKESGEMDMCRVQKTIVNRVKALCKERNLSYYMLAHQSGVPSTTMFHLVDGSTKSTRITTIVKICSGLEMTLEEFFSTPEFEELLSEVSEED